MLDSRCARVCVLGSLFAGGGCSGSPQEGPHTAASSEEADGVDADEEGPAFICIPGAQRCSESGGIEICDATGLSWNEEACALYENCKVCVGEDDPLCEGLEVRCAGPCDLTRENPSSMGCSFVSLWMPRGLETDKTVQALQVTNPDAERDASVKLFEIELGQRDEVEVEAVMLAPGEHIRWELPAMELISTTSIARTGGLWRVSSDLPVAVHQYSPDSFEPNFGATGGGTLLLPEAAFRGDFIAVSHTAKAAPLVMESYFTVVALEDATVVGWRPTQDPTSGNSLPLPPAEPGERVELTLNRYDWVRVHAVDQALTLLPTADVSGTVIDASAPVAAFGAVPCALVPTAEVASNVWGAECDPMQEQLLPLHFWGTQYVLPTPPERDPLETFELRIIASGPGQVSETTGSGLGPWNFSERGEFAVEKVSTAELAQGQAGFVLEGDVAFMPVVYTRSQRLNTGLDTLPYGDPGMTQLSPVAQFLDRHAFSTPETFVYNFLQLIRAQGADEVLLNDEVVEGWSTLGDFEVATLGLGLGEAYVLTSEDPFGSLRFGYQGIPDNHLYASGYACVGSLGITELTIP